MTAYLSKKIKILSAISILMVLYIHMYYTEGNNMPILHIMEGTMGQYCLIAVPLFYLISGYLFFLKMPEGIHSIPGKLRKRVRTLLIPYIIANILTFAFYVALNILIWEVPSLGSIVNFRVLDEAVENGVWDTLCLVFINPPIAFQLWFVRDLMVAMICSPLLYAIIKWGVATKWRTVLLFAILLIALAIPSKVPLLSAFIWFTAGGVAAIGEYQIERSVPKISIYILSFIYLFIPIIAQFCTLTPWIGHYIPLVGILAIWGIYDIIAHTYVTYTNNRLTTECFSYTFFVYLCHEPLLNIFKKLPLLISRSETILIASYILTPVIFYIFACCLGRLIKAISPKIYYVYTGGR
jgi:hypothetical protein